ncbi:protein SODIUM POTASSIUM ROOT DEFECTIVE [Trifolium repens]|nr:protein SODIUM POTASSIUM ROOT DEFECTIVE [Trifolium repens]
MFCSSPASTAIIHSSSTMDQRSMLRRSRSTKTYDHERRKNQLHHVPCSSQLPINPMPYFEKHRKSSSDKQNSSTTTETRRKSSANVNDLSSRKYLLLDDDAPFIDWLSESSKILVPRCEAEAVSVDKKRKNDSHALIRSSSSTLSSKDQVVILRVSLHCKACEGKVRKHISKMEGVRSFNIEMETKKVTIIGDVTPLGVLASVSKVKSAQLWPSTTSSSRPTFP